MTKYASKIYPQISPASFVKLTVKLMYPYQIAKCIWAKAKPSGLIHALIPEKGSFHNFPKRETINLSVNPILIVLQVSLSSVKPWPSSRTILGMSVNIQKHPCSLWDIRGNFPSLHWRGRVKDVNHATRVSRMGLRTLEMSYKYQLKIRSAKTLKSNSLIFP